MFWFYLINTVPKLILLINWVPVHTLIILTVIINTSENVSSWYCVKNGLNVCLLIKYKGFNTHKIKIYLNMQNTFLKSSSKAIAVFGEFLLVLHF